MAPKRAALAEANKKLDAANKKLVGIRARVAELKAKVEALEANLSKATEDKNAAVAAADKTETKAKLADRLINGLSGENKRWSATIKTFDAQVRAGSLTCSTFAVNCCQRRFCLNANVLPECQGSVVLFQAMCIQVVHDSFNGLPLTPGLACRRVS